MHLPMSYYFLKHSSSSQLCESFGRKKNHVIQGKINPYKHLAEAMMLTR